MARYRPNPRRSSKRKKRASKSRTKAYQVHEFLLDRETFDLPTARAWLKSHGHSASQLSFSEDFIHAVQFPRGDYRPGTLHNIQVAKHVQATVGIPYEGSDAAEAPGYNLRGPKQAKMKFTPAGQVAIGHTADYDPEEPPLSDYNLPF